MIHYDNYLGYFDHGAAVTMCVTVPLYLLHAFKLGAMDDEEKFIKYIVKPFGLEKVAFTSDDIADELANLIVTEDYYYEFAKRYVVDMDHDVKDIFEKDIQLYYGLEVKKQLAYDSTIDMVGYPCILSYHKAINAIREIYSVDIYRETPNTDWQNFFINYASYAIESIVLEMVGDTTAARRDARVISGHKMIHSVIKSLIGSSIHFGGQNNTQALRMFLDQYDVADLYKYLSDHVFRDASQCNNSIDAAMVVSRNCEIAGRLMMAFFTMEVFPNCDYDTVCTNFLRDELEPEDYAIYNKLQTRKPDLLSSGLVTLDVISSYYFSVLCPDIVLTRGKGIGVSELKTYMFDPNAYFAVTSTLREVGFTSENAKEVLVRSLKDPSYKVYPGVYTLCEYLADNALIVTGDVDSTMTPVHAAWNFADFMRNYWLGEVPLAHKYILVSNFLTEIISDRSAGNLINSTEKFFVTYRQICDAADKISNAIDDVKDTTDTKEFEASLKEVLISKYGSLNAATYVGKVSSDFIDFLNELVMTRIMY